MRNHLWSAALFLYEERNTTRKLHTNMNRVIGIRSRMLYGHFIEHFHRKIYGGVYDPESPLDDEDRF